MIRYLKNSITLLKQIPRPPKFGQHFETWWYRFHREDHNWDDHIYHMTSLTSPDLRNTKFLLSHKLWHQNQMRHDDLHKKCILILINAMIWLILIYNIEDFPYDHSENFQHHFWYQEYLRASWYCVRNIT